MHISLRQKLSSVEIILIDEISMVSSKLMQEINLHLCEIFFSDKPFGEKSVIACGDLFQLPPVRGKTVYNCDVEKIQRILSFELWDKFCIAELTEVMRQRGDDIFIDLLNKVRIGDIDESVESLLRQRFIEPGSVDYSHDALHIFGENEPANKHNEEMLNRISGPSIQVAAIDEFPQEYNIPTSDLRNLQNAKLSNTGELIYILIVKIGARVMITKNIDLKDRLINGQIGTIMQFKFKNDDLVKIYIKLDDERAGVKALNSDPISRENMWIPITRSEAFFTLKARSANSSMIRRTQFPLMLSWACTCHKVQGLSLPEAVISFTLNKQRRFNPGQMYVALSRVTSLNGLHLIGNVSRSAIQHNTAAAIEYDRLRIESPLVPSNRRFRIC